MARVLGVSSLNPAGCKLEDMAIELLVGGVDEPIEPFGGVSPHR